MEKIKVKLKKYTYTLIREPAPTDKIAGCFGCFFCKRRDGNYIQTCGPYKLGSCGSIFKKNHTIFKLIKENVMEPIEMIWAMFKVYLNNPNYYVKQEDILANVCGNGSRDVRKMMNSLGIHKGNPSTLTYGQLLKQCNII